MFEIKEEKRKNQLNKDFQVFFTIAAFHCTKRRFIGLTGTANIVPAMFLNVTTLTNAAKLF
jgi:hypothetical protein